MVAAAAEAIIANADELTSLDQAIGDGDHGINMKRGSAEVLAELDDIAAKPAGEALKAVGMALVMKVGGASGPLYGTLFMPWVSRSATGRRRFSFCLRRSRPASTQSAHAANRP